MPEQDLTGPGGWLTPTADAFLKAYYASLSPAVQQAMMTASEPERIAALTARAQAGDIIDAPIMAFWWHPYWTMRARVALGWTWVPSALQADGPGGGGPVPAGAVRVINPDDPTQWPAPFTPPAPPPVQGTDYVGKRNPIWDMYGMGQGYDANSDVVRLRDTPSADRYMLQNGEERTEDGHTFTFRVIKTMIGESYFFTLKP